MFQYATRHKILVNTDLITNDEAESLFEKNRHDFIERTEKGEEPEMCIWVGCSNNSSYGQTSKYWHHEEIKIIDGQAFIKA